MTTELFDVIEVAIKAPHGERVIATGKTKANAEAIVNMAVMRRGVEESFFTIRTALTQDDGR